MFTAAYTNGRSKASVYGRSLAGIAGAYPAGGMDVCLLGLFCVVRQMSLRWADPSSRGVPPTLVCHCVCDLQTSKNEAALAHVGLLCPKKKIIIKYTQIHYLI